MSEKNLTKNDTNSIFPTSNQNNITSDKIVQNNQNLKMDILQFKDEMLREIKLIKKSITEKYDLSLTFMKERFEKYDLKLSNQSERISDIKTNITSNDDVVKEVKTLLEFKDKIKEQFLTMNIKINNIDREAKNGIFRIDNILSDSVVYPSVVGPVAKFKTFHQMIDYILSQISQNLTFRDKVTLDINQIRKSISSVDQNVQIVKDNMSKEINILIDVKLKKILKEANEKLENSREQINKYIQELQESSIKIKEKLEEFEVIKNKISEEIKEEGRKLKEENDNTQNIFKGYKKEFNLIKDRFTQLSEFIKDVRFKINLGEEVKRKDLNYISSKIDFNKKQKVSDDKYLNLYNNKYQNDSDLPDFLKNHINFNNEIIKRKISNEEDISSKRTKNKNTENDKIRKRLKEGRNKDLNLGENLTNKVNKISYEIIDDYESDRNNSIYKERKKRKFFLLRDKANADIEKENNSTDSKRRGMLKRRNTTNFENINIEILNKLENRNTQKNEKIIKEILGNSNIKDNKNQLEKKGNSNPINNQSEQKNNMNNLKDITKETLDKGKNRYQVLDKKAINKELPKDTSRKKFMNLDNTQQNKLLYSLNNKENSKIKNILPFSERINNSLKQNSNSKENHRLISPKSQFTSTKDNINNKIVSNKNSTIYFSKKATVKSLARVQSAFSFEYPNISNSQPLLKMSNSLNNINIDSQDKNSFYISKIIKSKSTLEEDKMINTTKISNLKKTINISNKYKNHLSPNVTILQHSVEHLYENSKEANDLTGMISNLQKYINGYNSHYINKKDIKEEQKKLAKNSDYFKLKDFINGSINNEKKSQKNKKNLVEIGFNLK